MTDASGTTTYNSYDNNGHPTQVSKPGGNLLYTYDLAGNLTLLSSGNNVNYSYDALERLATVVSRDVQGNPLTTSYGYDPVGNLQTVTYPNGVVHNYTYNTRNQLTNLGVTKGAGTPTPIASYGYTLDAAGHRTGVTELSGRTVSYGYDNLYRLTNETIASDPNGVNGTASYVYDAVGNRTQKTSTIPGYPGGLTNYNANDQLSTDTYDADGNTTASNGVGYVYDFENRLVQAGGGISIVYDGDGNRVSKTVAGVTTTYLVDDQNPTGYAQVVAETFSGGTGARELSHAYVYGLERISEQRSFFTGTQSPTQFIYYAYDGHGSVRALTDPTGNVTDTYDYDAFGNIVHSTGTTPNNYLFAGEQFDPYLGLYYNRARYLNVSTDRFWSKDSLDGDQESPSTLHGYLYANASPVDESDPSGLATIAETAEAGSLGIRLDASRIFNVAKTLVIATALTCSAATAISLGASIVGAPDLPEGTPCSRSFLGRMRFQLHEQMGGITVHTAGGIVLVAHPPEKGVTVSQIEFEGLPAVLLAATNAPWFPSNRLQVQLDVALAEILARVIKIPPNGVSGFRRNVVQAIIPARRSTFRIDLDNLNGTNLTK